MATSDKPTASVDPETALAHKFPVVSFSYDERDVALYALGVGACGTDAVDEKELHFVHHRDGQRHIKPLPTFASLFPNKNSNGLGIVDVPGIHFDASLLLHGQQYIEIYKSIPSRASVVNKVKVAGLHDKAVFGQSALQLLSSFEWPSLASLKLIWSNTKPTLRDYTQIFIILILRESNYS